MNLFEAKAAQTHCKNGHEFTPENTYLRPGHLRGNRDCRTCKTNRYFATKPPPKEKPPVTPPVKPQPKTPYDVFWGYTQWKDGHLLWTGPVDNRWGHPRFTMGGTTYYAKKVSMEVFNRPSLAGARWSVLCGEEACVHPDHLEDYRVARGKRAGTRCKVCSTPTKTTVTFEGEEVPWRMEFCWIHQSEVDRMGEDMLVAKMRREMLLKSGVRV